MPKQKDGGVVIEAYKQIYPSVSLRSTVPLSRGVCKDVINTKALILKN
ncbi:MAG: hypothetical protein IJL63_07695 [Clostridia bacterium]|nr:hypothetical protein [Clostridia bacterium]